MIEPPANLSVWQKPEAIAGDFGSVTTQAVDLVVVGAGVQGLSAALQAARRGLSVQVIEAASLGEGASGLNGGQVIPGMKFDPEALVAMLGPERGARLTEFSAGTADAVFSLISNEKLDVPHTRTGWIQAAHSETAMAAAAQRHRQWRAHGADVTLLNHAEIALLTGAKGYRGGWLDRRAGTIDPLAYVFALARLAVAQGVRIALNTRVTGLLRDGGGWRVATEGGGEVRAAKVLVATNAYSDTLVGGLAQSLVWLHSFQIATAPLPASLADIILPHGQAVSDSRRILVYFRKSPDNRLVLGGRGPMRAPAGAEDWQHQERALIRLYPVLAGHPIERRWFGRVAMTSDFLPHLHEPEPGLLMVAGCQGRGVGLMTALGAPLADYIADGDPSLLPLPISPIRPIPLHRFRRVGVAARIAWSRMLDRLER
ncbi:NAD(P)/FAD-dependent oxidoreductase [Rhizobium sp. SL42]|uniref:NAD(P)/FAD-dependent oxidoreductase n=1 Tax=Rhizobium sp. SL42 TaxID=2806346 RepID=UPI001F3F2412|nr:FAD-dependent oxidoreductase [Rhizobium sp. SL42]UJW74527.1 FAD-binding oxidoreductase [Rhizobium sp. SL42]